MRLHAWLLAAVGLCAIGCAHPVSGEERCLDQWLAARHLNAYGDAPDTVYAGGTPAFDEASGQATPRTEYVYQHHPEARKACAPTPAPP